MSWLRDDDRTVPPPERPSRWQTCWRCGCPDAEVFFSTLRCSNPECEAFDPNIVAEALEHERERHRRMRWDRG